MHRFSEVYGLWGLCNGAGAAATSSECIVGSFVSALVACQASVHAAQTVRGAAS